MGSQSCQGSSNCSNAGLYPISFSIPSCKLSSESKEKTKIFATIDPDNLATYVFNDEKTYYEDYQISMFGKTKKKAGWDCLRHYEILANGCIPWFQNLDKCPEKTMTHFPKKLVLEAMDLYYNNLLTDTLYNSYLSQLLDYTKNYLTTKKMAEYILQTANIKANSILFLSQNILPDYLRCLTLHGFKELLGDGCHDYPRIPHLYKDYVDYANLYGKGITYSRLLETSARNNSLDLTIENDIRSHKYECVVYGSIHRGMPLWSLVNEFYKPFEIILLCGEDEHNCNFKHYSEKYPLFLREL